MAKEPTKKAAPRKTAATKAAAPVKATPADKTAASKASAPERKSPKRVRTKVEAAKPAKSTPEPAPAAAPSVVQGGRAAAPEPVLTELVARYDCGFGSALYLRGEGAGLSWEDGVRMENTSADTWVWKTADSTGGIQVKVVLNDSIWSHGPNIALAAGKTTEIHPQFP